MENKAILWIGFNAFILVMLAVDLGVFHKKAHEVKLKEALTWSAIWIIIALIFNIFIWYQFGKTKAVEYLTGYIIEKSLSIDNIFVFVLIFKAFNVPSTYQHKVLFWGVTGALLMRAVFIFAGVSLIERFHWIIYLFGIFLIYTGIKIARDEGTRIEIENNRVLKLVRRIIPFTNEYHGPKFFIKKEKTFATPLLLVLVLVEVTDLIFAVDSIPAILAVTNDPFIVYTSNVFAIMGLRSLYFALAGSLKYFIYLHYGLAAILVFVGVKMIISGFFKMNPFISLVIIAVILAVSITASIIRTRKDKIHPKSAVRNPK
ncbi:MAG TPA: TerC family protein [Bacteroidales bacterium]|nr:TerC family protein [Bacteroidales bacterium]